MLTSEQYGIINEQLLKENASEFVSTLINCYANTVDRASELISYIPKIAERQLQIKQEKINQYSFATNLMLADRHLHPGKYYKLDLHGKFCMLFYTCQVHFSIGNANGSSVAGKAFFNEFVEMLKNKETFDYTDKKYWCWTYSIPGGADWLESVIRQNIDGEFQRPKESEC